MKTGPKSPMGYWHLEEGYDNVHTTFSCDGPEILFQEIKRSLQNHVGSNEESMEMLCKRSMKPPVLEGADEEEVWVIEGMPASLSCLAHGTPPPTFEWTREDDNLIRMNSSTYLSSWEGEEITLQHTNHQSAGDFICIASNGYPPSKSKRVRLFVSFTPFVRGPGSQIWASQGESISLTCLYAAYPVPQIVWILENHLGPRHLTEEYFTNTLQEGHPPYT
ncbi:hypothetical protein SK128_022177 [Halocaridina rubra]|uniref:Ig-like domain-containing protein n=1 Tax=Halocaridina rubra TaxID=373956 RepID=A0AAN9A1D1_HALRR